ncbi:MAG TPA: sigma-70 family RNA polymerase sigma factor [Acidobacteriaceae bacterium]|nr:sigma-70 family RNA polymerase sigma factor [Acidobacteriaceae bacterium]
MLMPPADSVQELSFPTELAFPSAASRGSAAKPCENERVVILLFEQFRNPLLRYVISLGLSVHDGEEIIQEVFLALFRHLELGKSRRNLRGWIFQVSHNLALKQRAANQKIGEQLDSGEAERQADTNPSPEEQAANRQWQQRLQAILRALPEQDRCCLYLRAEGLRYREIASTLGMSLGAVSIALTRSLARMKRASEG